MRFVMTPHCTVETQQHATRHAPMRRRFGALLVHQRDAITRARDHTRSGNFNLIDFSLNVNRNADSMSTPARSAAMIA